MLININENKIFQEVYFGKTPEILKIENQLDKFRLKYLDRYFNTMNINSDPDLLKLNRMFEKQFGFGCFTLHIVNQMIGNAVTFPIDMRFDIFNTNKNIIANKNTFKFDEKADYSCIVCVYSGIMLNSAFTTEEVMACILHEIGHNFYSALDKKHGFLINIYSAILFVSGIYDIIKDIKYIKGVKDVEKDPIWGVIIANDIEQSKKHIADTSIRMIKNTETYRKIVDKIERYLRENNSLIMQVYDIFDFIKSMIANVNIFASGIYDILTLGVGRILGSVRYIEQKALNPFTYILMPIQYTNERLADNFPTMYGYGPATVSLTSKFGSLDSSSSKIIQEFNNIPVLSNIYNLNADAAQIIISVFDEHPTAFSRALDQIRLLEREAAKSDLDPKMKKVILEDIKVSKKSLEKLIDTSITIENKNILRNIYNKAILDNCNSGSLKELILDDKKKFDIYDKTYNDKFTT